MRSELSDVAGSNVPSSDTVIRVLRQFTFPQKEVVNRNNGINKIVDNAPLNELLCALAAKCHKNSIEPTLDIDAHIASCDKRDADFAYTKEKGYAPIVAFIERCPVSIQNRSGNTSPAFGHIEFVKRTLSMLDDNDIKIKNFRADAVSYNYDLMKELDNRKIRFYIRAAQSPAIAACIASLSESSWNKGKLNGKEIEVAEIEYNGYRVIVERTKTGQYNLFTGSAYTYRAIITNDKRKEMTPDNVIYFYNHSGDIERNFDLLRNDFGWTNLPFDNIAENTTYLIITACFMNLFEIIKKGLVGLSKLVYQSMRTKSFVFHFLAIPAKVIKRSRTRIIKFYTQENFAKFESLVT